MSSSVPRVVFMGTADLACATLLRLATSPDLRLITVVSQPDKPKGRDLQLTPTPVKAAALKLGIPVLQPLKARDPAFVEQLRSLSPDLIVVAAYGQILPKSILEMGRFGCINVHTSLLPRYRGAAPIQWAIVNGDPVTGITLMQMDEGLDTGPILAVRKTPILDSDTGQTLHDRLASMGGDFLAESLPQVFKGAIQPVPQPAVGVSYARKITKEDGRILWDASAKAIWNRIRGFTPWPGAFTTLPGALPKLLKVLEAEPTSSEAGAVPGQVLVASRDQFIVACGSGAVSLKSVQREGARRMTAAEFTAGAKLQPGMILGAAPGI